MYQGEIGNNLHESSKLLLVCLDIGVISLVSCTVTGRSDREELQIGQNCGYIGLKYGKQGVGQAEKWHRRNVVRVVESNVTMYQSLAFTFGKPPQNLQTFLAHIQIHIF